jgi:hypothetical protein
VLQSRLNRQAFRGTADDVLDRFLKPAIKRDAAELLTLRHIVDDYSEDLANFFEGLAKLTREADARPEYYKVFALLGLSASLYPLAVRLAMRNLLDQPIPTAPDRTFLDALATADLRVYKTRGTRPEKHMAELARDARSIEPSEIVKRFRDFVSLFMADDEFRTVLSRQVYGSNGGVRYIFVHYDDDCRRRQDGRRSTITELKGFRKENPTIDHVLAQSPGFTLPARDFTTEDNYRAQIDRLGNLTIVEEELTARHKHGRRNRKQLRQAYTRRAAMCPREGLLRPSGASSKRVAIRRDRHRGAHEMPRAILPG